MYKLELDVVSETPINVHTHTDEAARPLVQADTRKWLDGLGLTDVTFVIKQVFGPGGGASVIDFIAPTKGHLLVLARDYDAGNGEVDFLMEGAEAL